MRYLGRALTHIINISTRHYLLDQVSMYVDADGMIMQRARSFDQHILQCITPLPTYLGTEPIKLSSKLRVVEGQARAVRRMHVKPYILMYTPWVR